MVTVNSPHEDSRYALYTERSGFGKPEFKTDERKVLVGYLNALGPQLAQQGQEEDEIPDLEDFEPGTEEVCNLNMKQGGLML